MKERNKNILYVLIIIIITALIMFILASIPNYLRPMNAEDIELLQAKFIIIFILANIILIGVPAGIHYLYIKDYSKIKNIWFFAIFGGIVGAFLGEIIPHGANPLIIITYIIFMFIYAQFYKRFTWWKVALTSYLAGVLIESGMNRSPLQTPSLIWIAFFTYPYFVTKIWENRKRIPLSKIAKDFKWAIFLTILIGAVTGYFFREGPLFFFAIAIPWIIAVPYKLLNKKKKKQVPMITTILNLKYTIISAIILGILTKYYFPEGPLYLMIIALIFLIRFIYWIIKKN